jgi:acetate kinase
MTKILVINAGSSGHKSCLYEVPKFAPVAPPRPLWQAQIDRQQMPPLLIATGAGQTVKIDLADDKKELEQMLSTLSQGETAVLSDIQEIAAVGHRVVHGGQDYQQTVWIDEDVKAAIARLIPLAPAHNSVSLEGIKLIEQLWEDIPQFAAFDTAFHSHMPETAALYPVPRDWIEQGIRRYGFHGISHQYCAHRAAELLGQPLNSLRLVIAHLGNGCSLAAVKNGYSIDTTMGFTPLDGLMMGTRSGSVDPGILLYLMREKGYTHEQLDHLLNKCSGLKGISGLSGDMRVLEEAIASNHPQAKLAVEMYLHRLRAGIAAMTASLGGLDALIFTGGVSEHTPRIRAETCKALAFLGIELAEEKNAQIKGDQRDHKISPDRAKVSVFVISTQEEWQIAREYSQLQS